MSVFNLQRKRRRPWLSRRQRKSKPKRKKGRSRERPEGRREETGETEIKGLRGEGTIEEREM